MNQKSHFLTMESEIKNNCSVDRLKEMLAQVPAEYRDEAMINSLVIPAIRSGNKQMVKWLLENGADIDLRPEVGNPLYYTPIYAAITYDKPDILEFLCDSGAEMNSEESGSGTPLYYAVKSNKTACALVLVEKSAICKGPHPGFLWWAAKGCATEVVKTWLRYNVGVSFKIEEIYNALVEALSFAEREAFADLMIDLAIQQDLFNQPLDIEKLLMKAADYKRGRQIDAIAKHIKPENLTWLSAVVVGNMDRVSQLIEERVDLEACRDNYFHYNALNYAAIRGHTDIVRLLVKSGMNAFYVCDDFHGQYDLKGNPTGYYFQKITSITKLKCIVKIEDASVARLLAHQLSRKKPDVRKITTQYLKEYPFLAIPALLRVENSDMEFLRQLVAGNPAIAEKLLPGLPRDAGEKLQAIIDQNPNVGEEATPEEHPDILMTPRWRNQKRRPKKSISKALSLTMLPYNEDIRWEEDLDQLFYDVFNPYLPSDAWSDFWNDVNLDFIFDFDLILSPEKLMDIDEGKPTIQYTGEITRWIGKCDELAEELKIAYLKVTLYHLGPVAIPLLNKLFEKKPIYVAAALENVDSPRVAVVMARAFSKRGGQRSAYTWFKRFPEAAAIGLMPAVFGKDKKFKKLSSEALLAVIGLGRQGMVRDIAGRYGEDVQKAIQPLLAWDLLDDYPARIPRMPAFWIAGGLPRPVLSVCDKMISLNAMQCLGEMLSFSSAGAPYEGLRQVKEACDSQSLSAFAWELFTSWLRAGADPKTDWAMMALGYLSNDGCVDKLCGYIAKWPGDGAARRAVRGIDVLAEIRTDKALWKLKHLQQQSRYKSIKKAAAAAIEQISSDRGLTRDELTDRIVPDLGFEKDASMVFDYGPRQFTVGFAQTFKYYIKNSDGKKLRALPRAKEGDDIHKAAEAASTWRQLKKDMAVIVKERSLHLELAMAGRRFWDGKVFRGLFLAHPILRLYVKGLVWGLYDSGKKLQSTIRLDAEGKGVTAFGQQIEIADAMTVGIVHPKEAPREDLMHWRDGLEKDKIVQPFSQLDRPVFTPTADEVRTGGIIRANETISGYGRLQVFEKRGWRRPPGPASFLNHNAWIYSKAFPGGHLLKFQIAPYYDDDDETLSRVHLGYAQLENKDVSRVHPVIFSEMIYDIMYIAGKLNTKDETKALVAPK